MTVGKCDMIGFGKLYKSRKPDEYKCRIMKKCWRIGDFLKKVKTLVWK